MIKQILVTVHVFSRPESAFSLFRERLSEILQTWGKRFRGDWLPKEMHFGTHGPFVAVSRRSLKAVLRFGWLGKNYQKKKNRRS